MGRLVARRAAETFGCRGAESRGLTRWVGFVSLFDQILHEFIHRFESDVLKAPFCCVGCNCRHWRIYEILDFMRTRTSWPLGDTLDAFIYAFVKCIADRSVHIFPVASRTCIPGASNHEDKQNENASHSFTCSKELVLSPNPSDASRRPSWRRIGNSVTWSSCCEKAGEIGDDRFHRVG